MLLDHCYMHSVCCWALRSEKLFWVVIFHLRQTMAFLSLSLYDTTGCAPRMQFISWYQGIKFLISRNGILDIKKSISWYQEFHFLIFKIRFLDVKNSISWYQEIVNISWYQGIQFLISRFHYLISRNQILNVKKYLINSKIAAQNIFLDIKKSISWYQEMDFLISRKNFISWYQEIDFLISRNEFLISRNQILDIKKYLIVKRRLSIHFLISRNWFLDIKKWFLDIRNSISWYQEMCIISWYQEIEFLMSRNAE